MSELFYQRCTRSIRCYVLLFLSAMGLSACASEPGPTVATQKNTAALLSQTGLYDDIAQGALAKGVQAFTPQFALWTDGAKKRRWIYLPAGKTIDTSKMDRWVFPVGTKLWKEFSKDGKRIETRLMEKVGEGIQSWVIVSYRWREDQSDADKTLSGGSNEQNTTHDIPSAGQCISCHGGTSSVALGFSAIQLSHEKSETTLSSLAKENKLSHPPKSHFQIPGTPLERSVLGYLHANCGHCHHDDNNNAWMNPSRSFRFDLKTTQLGAVSQTELYKTGTQAGSGNKYRLLVPGAPEQSSLYNMIRRNEMPPLGVEQVDQKALDTISQWIKQFQP